MGRRIGRIFAFKRSILIFAVVLAIHLFSSFDTCWFFASEGITDNGFVYGSDWREHLHSSEEWAIYYQIQALREGRPWLSRGSPPKITTDVFRIGEYYYAPFEPLTAFMLLPFHVVGEALLGGNFLIRSVLFGMVFYTCLGALLVRRIASKMGQSQITADLASLLFALTTMAFSYSRLLYPQPIVGLFIFLTIASLFNYKKSRAKSDLFFTSFFYGLTVVSFNASVVAIPFILFFLVKNGFFRKTEDYFASGLGLLPAILLFVGWNYSVTGYPLVTPRQIVHPSMSFDFARVAADGTWLNMEGLFGSLFSPLGIFFVSPILFASFIGFSSLKSRVRDETILLTSMVIAFWGFMSFVNLGGYAGRDFWVGGWANIARHMYVPSSILVLLASEAFENISKNRNLLGAWLISGSCIVSFLANFSYGIRHDLMVGRLKDFMSNSLLIWPYPLHVREVAFFSVIGISASVVYPILLARRQKGITADLVKVTR